MPIILRNHYVLAVHNVRSSADFYVNMLGFRVVAEPPGWIFVERDNCIIMMGECPDDMAPADLGCHNYFSYLQVDNADEFYEDVVAKGVEIVAPIADKPWQMREFGLRTVDGHRIMIGQEIE